MPAYLVKLPDRGGWTLEGGHNSMIVFAADAAGAKEVAKSASKIDGNPPWDAATVTEILAATDLSDGDFELRIAVLDSAPVVDVAAKGGVLGASGVAIADGGTGYTVNDILTVAGGTSTRACTLRVTSVSTGVIDGIELVDPGEYTALPANPAGVTGGTGNDDATFNLTGTTKAFANFAAEAVGLLNATAPIAGAAIDMGAAPPLLTIASGGGGDDLGDKDAVVEFKRNSVPISALLGTVTDKGVASDPLSVELPAAPVLPNVVAQLKD